MGIARQREQYTPIARGFDMHAIEIEPQGLTVHFEKATPVVDLGDLSLRSAVAPQCTDPPRSEAAGSRGFRPDLLRTVARRFGRAAADRLEEVLAG